MWDNPATVSAIAQKAGIEGAENLIDARNLADGRRLAPGGEPIYGLWSGDTRAKESLVEGLQVSKHKVAMTERWRQRYSGPQTADCSIAMESGKMMHQKDGASGFTRFRLWEDASPSWQKVGGVNIQRSASLLIKNIFHFVGYLSDVLAFTYPIMPSQMSDQWFYNWDPPVGAH